MKNLSMLTGVTAVVLAAALMTASPSFAKGHDQGSTNDPGQNVGSQTVDDAQGLGSKGPADTPAGATPGNSGNAGRSGDKGGNGGDMSGKK